MKFYILIFLIAITGSCKKNKTITDNVYVMSSEFIELDIPQKTELIVSFSNILYLFSNGKFNKITTPDNIQLKVIRCV